MIRMNVSPFLESGEIISWTTLQGITKSEFTVGSMIFDQLMSSVSSAQADSTEHSGEHLNTDPYHNP